MDPKHFTLDIRQTISSSGNDWITVAQITYTPTREYVTKRWTVNSAHGGYGMAWAWYVAVLSGSEGKPDQKAEPVEYSDGWIQLPLL